jgi:hypothetical protein
MTAPQRRQYAGHGGRVIGPMLACDIVDSFLNGQFEGGRHQGASTKSRRSKRKNRRKLTERLKEVVFQSKQRRETPMSKLVVMDHP